MRLVWKPESRAELRAILDYISEFNADAANRLLNLIESYAERLPQFPFLGRPGRIPGTREAVVHPNYILIYRVGRDAVEIVSVLHSRKQYPPTQAD